jgi:peroxiredoxin Q/BCP
MTLTISQPAPDFSTVDHLGTPQRLRDYRGKYVLLYFYPADNTPGCTAQACAFRDNYSDLNQELVILGVSADSQESHLQFAEKHQLPFPLLVDPDQTIIRAYAAQGSLFKKRISYLIDPAGIIVKIYSNVNVNTHARDILNDIRAMKQAAPAA